MRTKAKDRSPGQVAVSFSLDGQLLTAMDERCRRLGVTRSQYIRNLASNDLLAGGPLTLQPTRGGIELNERA